MIPAFDGLCQHGATSFVVQGFEGVVDPVDVVGLETFLLVVMDEEGFQLIEREKLGSVTDRGTWILIYELS